MAAAAQYFNFVPPHKLVEEADKKEQLRVQLDNHGKLRISGERQVSGNQWKCFRKEFQVPEDCNAGDIRARFDSKDGVLHITMPKLSPAEEEPKAAAAGMEGGQGAAAPAGDGAAQQTAAQPEEKATQQTAAPDAEEKYQENDDGESEEPGDTGRRKTSWTVLLAVVLALLAAAGFYAKYRLMDPSAEPAPADGGHIFGLSDH
ncbi:hypothetical protein E2562_030682 [Oryza meyeriana var. granulata]|uniref:SHSP domain-containing protein n=1 Tax=Oryza meyeriana var. granulata TaxID=110450 RepID=A0A6G1DQB0_9ORYZ|nr:hypothetical protein E2562_030682 [Oryza meyeriana var. granulata]